MANKKKAKGNKQDEGRSFADRRTANPPAGGIKDATQGGSFQEHDAKRRLGSFESAGEHARTGNRRQ
jgi:hypothetical protein